MAQPTDSTFQRQMDEFTRHMEALQLQHQQIAYALCVERMARDMDILAAPVQPPSILHRIGHWLDERLDRATPVTTMRAVESGIIIIDAATGEVTDEMEVSNG